MTITQALKQARDSASANLKRIETTIQNKEAELIKLRENRLISVGRLEAYENAISVMTQGNNNE